MLEMLCIIAGDMVCIFIWRNRSIFAMPATAIDVGIMATTWLVAWYTSSSGMAASSLVGVIHLTMHLHCQDDPSMTADLAKCMMALLNQVLEYPPSEHCAFAAT